MKCGLYLLVTGGVCEGQIGTLKSRHGISAPYVCLKELISNEMMVVLMRDVREATAIERLAYIAQTAGPR